MWKLFHIFESNNYLLKAKFEVELLEEALDFVKNLDDKTRRKVIYNLDKAALINDPKLFKKLDDDIWEFRTKFSGLQYRVLAFWEKRNGKIALVIATHGFIKKVSKVPKAELKKAKAIRTKYLDSK